MRKRFVNIPDLWFVVPINAVPYLVAVALCPDFEAGKPGGAFERAANNHRDALYRAIAAGEYRVRNDDASIRPADAMLIPSGFLSVRDFIKYANDVGVDVEIRNTEQPPDSVQVTPGSSGPTRRRRARADAIANDIEAVVKLLNTYDTMAVWTELLSRAEKKVGSMLKVDDGIHWKPRQGKPKILTFESLSDRLGRLFAAQTSSK